MIYDATGLRRQKQEGGGVAKFVWDGANVLLETDAGGTTQSAYTLTGEQYGDLLSQRRDDASSFYHFDALGSTTELTDGGANATDSYRYHAFGETRVRTGTTSNPFGFVGRLGYYTEDELGLQYLRARWYQPAAGRFLSRDPVGGLAGEYTYVAQRPTWAVDPSGLVAWVPIIAIIVRIGTVLAFLYGLYKLGKWAWQLGQCVKALSDAYALATKMKQEDPFDTAERTCKLYQSDPWKRVMSICPAWVMALLSGPPGVPKVPGG